MTTGVAPADSDFEPLRAWARARATEGVRLEDLLRAFGLGGQIGWELMRRYARADEADALLDGAGLLMRYVDRVSAVVTDTYLAERELLVSEDERRTRQLLERLIGPAPLDADDRELARRLAVPVEDAYAPFAIVMPGRAPRRHAALAARLRGRGWTLTVTEGDRVVGLTWKALDPGDLDEGPDVLLAIARPARREALADARHDLVVLAEHGRRLGLRGRLDADDHLLEILMGRSPRLAARLRATVLGPLGDPDHRELLRTLQVLVSCRFDRGATSAALHVHRIYAGLPPAAHPGDRRPGSRRATMISRACTWPRAPSGLARSRWKPPLSGGNRFSSPAGWPGQPVGDGAICTYRRLISVQ